MTTSLGIDAAFASTEPPSFPHRSASQTAAETGQATDLSPEPLAVLADLMAPLGTTPGAPELDALHRALARLPMADRMTLGHRRRSALLVQATTDSTAEAMDIAQAIIGQGPTVDALESQQVTASEDLRTDPRWPALADSVPAPIRSALSIPLAASGHPDSVVTAYSEKSGAFDDAAAVEAAIGAAATVALTLTASNWRTSAENFTVALTSSRRIGAAIGVLMYAMHLTDDQAFEALRMVSQDTHRKLRDVAEDVILTGTLPPRRPGRTAGPR